MSDSPGRSFAEEVGMSFGSVTPILILAFAAVLVVGVIVRLVVASRQRRTLAAAALDEKHGIQEH